MVCQLMQSTWTGGGSWSPLPSPCPLPHRQNSWRPCRSSRKWTRSPQAVSPGNNMIGSVAKAKKKKHLLFNNFCSLFMAFIFATLIIVPSFLFYPRVFVIWSKMINIELVKLNSKSNSSVLFSDGYLVWQSIFKQWRIWPSFQTEGRFVRLLCWSQ